MPPLRVPESRCRWGEPGGEWVGTRASRGGSSHFSPAVWGSSGAMGNPEPHVPVLPSRAALPLTQARLWCPRGKNPSSPAPRCKAKAD